MRELCDGLECARTPDDATRWACDRAAVRERLRALVNAPAVREALHLASPALVERLPAWLADPDAEPGVEAGLFKYVARMTTRCTPFGTFASSSVGTIARATRLELPARAAAVRHTRLDMDFLSEAVALLAADPEVRALVTFAPNTSLYPVGSTLRYAEARRGESGRAYFLVGVEANEAVLAALAAARGGATLEAIATSLVGDEITLDDARDFVNQLIDAQMLVAELGPVVTGPDALEDVFARIARSAPAHPARAILAAARTALYYLDTVGLGEGPATYAALAELTATLVPVDPARLVQVDLHRPSDALTLDEGLVDEMLRAAELLIATFTKGRRDPLEPFRTAFEERYGDREVPLVEALDEELGIGFEVAQGPGSDPSPLLAHLPFVAPLEQNIQPWGERPQYVQWRAAEAIARGDVEVRLEPGEIERFHEPDAPGLPGAFHLMASLLAPDPREPDAPLAVFDSAAGPSGIRLLGRFGHGDPALLEHMRAHARAEEALRPDVAYFEIVHLPEGRIGNVLARPLLRELELEYLGVSGAPLDRRLHVTDLTVRLDSGRVALRSRALGREVRPRLTSAHYTGWKSLGVYRFLAALQAEGAIEGISWNWGPLEHQPRLPRVRMGRLILARQQWNAQPAEARRLRARRGHAAFAEVQRWRAERGLPRWVGLSHADNVLPVDLDNPLSVATFLDELSDDAPFALQELTPGAAPDAVETPEGRLTNEIVIPVTRRAVPIPPPRVRSTHADADRTRREGSFQPGSEWLTVKLYTGPATADRALVEVVAPALAALRAEGAVRLAFFVRYADPQWHVRLRMHGEPQALLGRAAPALHAAAAPLLAEGGIHRIVLEPYVRETTRYGGAAAVVECEALFAHDSETVLAFLALAGGERGLDARWRFALLGIDRLMDDFGLDLAARRTLVAEQAKGFAREMQVDHATRKAMMARYRDERRAIEALLAGEPAPDELLAAGARLLEARTRAGRPHVEALRRLERDGRLTVPIEELVASLAHMHANRVLRSSQRAQELVIHHYLENAYVSRAARAAGKKRT